MKRNAPTHREGKSLISVRLQNGVRQSCDEELMRYWCFSLHRLFLIPQAPPEHPSPAYDLGEYSVASFKILSDWMEDFRLPVFANTSDAINSYLLGWKLGAPVFCNLLMTRLCKLYEDCSNIPASMLVSEACKRPRAGNPIFKFVVHVYIRAEVRCKEASTEVFETIWALYPKVFQDLVKSDSPARDHIKGPGSLVANACDYHVHVGISPGDSLAVNCLA
ncbi:hypothetical protein IWX90DRAFT_420350 [Phyllosticta citrichinensis]|uniref:Transposase n=1 Tax=Phyllosticta citrichinensis TaxID=1130410 RepID=A0ABR1Y6B8_9PEZI